MMMEEIEELLIQNADEINDANDLLEINRLEAKYEDIIWSIKDLYVWGFPVDATQINSLDAYLENHRETAWDEIYDLLPSSSITSDLTATKKKAEIEWSYQEELRYGEHGCPCCDYTFNGPCGVAIKIRLV